MGMCPLCNGFDTYSGSCTNCGSTLVDTGKLTDYLDDYSAYMEIELMKMVDGEIPSLENDRCVHVITCPTCQNEQIIAIQE